MNPYQNLIKNTTLLNSLSLENIRLYLANGAFKVQTYAKNSIVHFEGDSCFKLEIILTGKVVVARIDESGNLLTIAEFYKDDILGGNLMFSKNPYYPMTTTTPEESVILEIEKNLLFNLLSESPIILKAYLEFVADHTFMLLLQLLHLLHPLYIACVKRGLIARVSLVHIRYLIMPKPVLTRIRDIMYSTLLARVSILKKKQPLTSALS